MRKFESFISKKNTTSTNQIFCVATACQKHKLKKRGHRSALVSSENDKGAISASNDHFARGDCSEFQDKHPFSRVELSKSLLKA